MKPGLYEQLLTAALQSDLEALNDRRLYDVAQVDAEESHVAVAQFLEHVIAGGLSRVRGRDEAERQRRLVDRLLHVLVEELHEIDAHGLHLVTPLQRLLAVHRAGREIRAERPDSPLGRSALFTGTRLDPSLGSQLRKELATADRVDILCSFIKWSGLRTLLPDLQQLAERSTARPSIRLITTSYMGATDPRAVETLQRLPHTSVRVSYDTKRTRLHAKAYIFHRETGFGSAYVGSANVSQAALSEGLEWTTKVSQYELPYLWNKIAATFEAYWQDDEFQSFEADAPERFREAIRREGHGGSGATPAFTFDLRPYPFQEEILDVLAAEREVQKKFHQLVVAATGTGKTMIAAFDYARICRKLSERPSLLFIAHREEILRQAMAAFRAVLRDQNFGDLLVGGAVPDQVRHVFCSIQSYNAKEMWRRESEEFCYVVVDEFHHAAAPSYRRLLDAIQPQYLLALTATPERSDQIDVLQWFGGRCSAEIRLPDAINRRLLCPFQYFGVADSVDLSGVTWQRGGYRVDDLDQLYTGNDVRAALVLQKVHDIVLNPLRARGLGFCVSVAHAEFMARFFTEQGIPSVSLTGQSADAVRYAAQDQLRSRTINFVFVVDLYNEGVDLPEVDTLLFLRPTESLTVYLQQLGRGLRLHDDKDCLTVLDFIGTQRREFRFALRFRALTTNPTARLDREVERGFPHLPSGCTVQLERVAQQRVLENLRDAVQLLRPRLIGQLRDFGRVLARTPTILETLEYTDTSLEELLKRGLWSELLHEASLATAPNCPDAGQLRKGVLRFCHVDDIVLIRAWMAYLDWIDRPDQERQIDQRWAEMLHVTLWGKLGSGWSLGRAESQLRVNPAVISDVRDVLAYRLTQAPATRAESVPGPADPLRLHARYSRDEILVGLGHWTLAARPDFREGTLHLAGPRIDAFFVTLQKSEDDYSPTTMYEDYVISAERFHWQSRSNTSVDSPTGQRLIRHREQGYTPILFVRETRETSAGTTAPYVFFGACEYESHSGSQPISIVWRLRTALPARLLRSMGGQNVA